MAALSPVRLTGCAIPWSTASPSCWSRRLSPTSWVLGRLGLGPGLVAQLAALDLAVLVARQGVEELHLSRVLVRRHDRLGVLLQALHGVGAGGLARPQPH